MFKMTFAINLCALFTYMYLFCQIIHVELFLSLPQDCVDVSYHSCIVPGVYCSKSIPAFCPPSSCGIQIGTTTPKTNRKHFRSFDISFCCHAWINEEGELIDIGFNEFQFQPVVL